MSTMKEILMFKGQTKGAIRLWPEGILTLIAKRKPLIAKNKVINNDK